MSIIRKIASLSVSTITFIFLLGVVAIPATAQTNKGTIKGTITDQNGAVVQKATITVTNVDTNASHTAEGGDDGTYEVPLLDPGKYTVSVKAPSFPETVRENVNVQTASTEVVDVTVTAGGVGGTVTVTAAPSMVQSETSDRGTVISGRQVTELPLSGRNFTQLATLTPGVARANNVGLGGGPEARAFNNGDPRAGNGGPGGSNENGSSESSRFNRSGGAAISANGQRATNNNFSLDGVDNNEPQFGTIGTFPNPDAIAEFKVTTSVPSADVGRAAGAVVTTTIKSGGNEFHGSGYYYGQNSALNAYHPVLKAHLNDILSQTSPNPLEVAASLKPVQQIHEFGGTIGGPIKKNQTFFFFDYLGQRNNLPFPANTTVPTAKSRTGDFSEFPTIRDPRTGLPYPGNVIPSGQISSVGSKYLNSYAQPTRTVFNPSGRLDCCGGRPNFFTQRANREVIDNYEVKIDHKLSSRNSLAGRFTDQRLTTTRANLVPGNIATTGFGAGEERGNSRQIAVTDTHTFSPTTLNEFRFGITQIQISIFNCGVGGACGVSPTYAQDIGIPNSNDGSLEASGGALIGNFNDGFLEFTGDGGLFQVKSKNPYFADTLTVIKGNQVLKFGGELRMRRLNTIDGGRTGSLKGQFQYGDRGPGTGPNPTCPAASGTTIACFVRPDGTPYGGTGNSQANILLGLPADLVTKSKIFGGPFNLRSQEWGLFVQDDWKVNDRLTLNLGLRYDLFTPFSEANGRYSLFDIAQRKVVVASGSGDKIIQTDKNNFGPRIGFAYAVDKDKKIVLRGGYGLLYTLDGVDYPPGVRNPPFSNSVSFDQFGIPTTGAVYSMVTGPPVVPQVDPANVPNFIGVFAVDPKQKVASTHQFQISVQYQLGKDYSLDVGFVGNRTRNLLYANDIGSSGLALAQNAAGQFINSAIIYSNGARSRYNGLQTQLIKRLSHNVQGQVAYTWSSTKDNSTGIFNGLGDSRNGRGGPINPFDLNRDFGPSSLDVRHLLSANAIIDLPFGKGKRYFNQGGALSKLFEGFQFNIIESARSGFRYSVVCDCGGGQRPNLIGDPFANVPAGRILNPAAFDTNPAHFNTVTNAAGNTIRFGNLGRNTFTGPSIFTTDASVFKNTKLRETLTMQIGVEFFNLFNHPNYSVPSNNANFGDFGSIRFNAMPGRVVQYRAKLIF
ncbi:MAG TPA: TonB-dependent receptor [Pyrinomonadaceae bacterium]|nr:TonB-dependent receptor [Pyrinomonadaceae bacterium]